MTKKVMDSDLVVLGAGGAGLVAAVRASECSGKKVIVLEKAKKTGGATYFAGGPGVGHPMGGPGPGGPGPGGPSGMPGGPNNASRELMAQFSKWFEAKVGLENMVSAARMEKYKKLPDPSIGPGRGGTFTVEKMLDFCTIQGVRILMEAPAKKIITDKGGKITGVLTTVDDTDLSSTVNHVLSHLEALGRIIKSLKNIGQKNIMAKKYFFSARLA